MKRSFPWRVVTVSLALLALATLPADGGAQVVERVALFSSEKVDIGGGAALSPDGRWLALSIMESPTRASLWVVPAGGGERQRLTSSGHWDGNPDWSPSGTELYFTSNRGAAAGDQSSYYGMAASFDSRTGQPVGEPRRITTDRVLQVLRPSPDGRSLAYVDLTDRRLLKVIPAAGGEARVVTQMPARSGNPVWSRDGTYLFFTTNTPDQSERILYRVAAAGAEPTVVTRALPQGRLIFAPGAEVFLREENGEGPRERSITVMDVSGKVLSTIATNRNTRAMQLTPDGRGVVVLESNVMAPTRVMPVAGGAYRDVTPASAYDWVMRWSPDGSAVYTWTENEGAAVLALVPVTGGEKKLYPETSGWASQGANSRYLFVATRRSGSNPRSIVAIDLQDGRRHEITAAAPGLNMILPNGPGGTWATHDELYYLERDGDRLHVKAWRAPGEARTVGSLPATLLGRTSFAAHGEQVAWQEERGDSVDVMISSSASAAPRRLFTMYRTVGTNEIAFSNDGRSLVLHYSRGPGAPDLMAVVDASGGRPPRIIDTGLAYWYWPRWMPDNSGVVVIGGGRGAEAHVVLVPMAEGAQPVNITRDDPSMKWGFELSPDGRYIAYPGEVWKGSSVWRITTGAN